MGPAKVPNLCRTRGKEWSQWPGLNRRPTVYETVALPLSYIGFQSALHSLIIAPPETRKFRRLSFIRIESLRHCGPGG